MSLAQTKEIAKCWMDAFNSHDLDKLVDLYAEDAIHFSPKLLIRRPETKGYIKGKAALRDWWKDAFERLPSLRYTPSNFIAENNCIFMEYIRSVKDEPELKVGEVLEINNGKIVGSRVYHA